jgi:hypothetical protein
MRVLISIYCIYRKTAETIARVNFVQPNQTERYALRLLLLNIKGACSFDDLRTFNGIIYNTFHEAAQKHGFLDDDKEWQKCLEEACHCETNCDRLRELFVIILTQCSPSNPHLLWLEFRDHLSHDVLMSQRRQRDEPNFQPDEQTYNTALYLTDLILSRLGRSLSDFPGMPTFDVNKVLGNNPQRSELINEELQYDQDELQAFLQSAVPSLNKDQKEIFDFITSDNENSNFLLFNIFFDF